MTSKTMNENQANLRLKMKEMLAKLPPANQRIFGLMYNHKNKFENHVDGVKPEQLDWAFSQIEETMRKLEAPPRAQGDE